MRRPLFVLLLKICRFFIMNRIIIFIAYLLTLSLTTAAQENDSVNITDEKGRKQGPWISSYPNGNARYEGVFKNNHPVGEFKRYFEDGTLMSIMVYSDDGEEVDATIYHPNGFIASKGKYINQEKEGKWSFYSYFYENYLINDEEYRDNKKNGTSVKYYPDTTVFELLNYVDDKKEGDWIQYYPDGKLFLKGSYSNDLLNGLFEVWYENGQKEISGNYKNNFRDGPWMIFSEEGEIKYEINYEMGMTKDKQMDIDHTNLMEKLEKNQDKIADPEKTLR